MEKIKVLFEDGLIKEGELWFFAKYFNGLLKLNIETGEMNIVSKIISYEYQKERLFVKLLEYQNLIVCIPMSAKEIWIYHIMDDIWESIPIHDKDDISGFGKFFQAFIYCNKVYMIPAFYEKIVILNLESYKVEYIEFLDFEAKKEQEINKDSYFRSSYAIVDNILYLASCNDNRILKFDLRTHINEWLSLNVSTSRFAGVIYDGNKFWLAPRKQGNVVIWDGDKCCKELIIPQLPEAYYQGIIINKSEMIISGQSECGNIIINCNKTIQTSKEHYLFNLILDDGYRVSLEHNGLLRICDVDGVIYKGPSEIERRQLARLMKGPNVFKEGKDLTLSMFIESVVIN